MYYAVSTDGKTWSAHKLGEGTWPLKACPMDGGGLALDGNGVFHSAWRRGGVVYAAPAGGKEVALGNGKNPSIAANRNGQYVAWTEGTAVKLMKPGASSPTTVGEGAFPVIAASDTAYIAWEHGGSSSRRFGKMSGMYRRSFVLSAAVMSAAAQVKPIDRKRRLKQSVCRWCYSKIGVEDFAKECARLGCGPSTWQSRRMARL